MSKKAKTSENANTKSLHHHAGRWLDEPKMEHKIVLQSIEIANKAFNRAVKISEIAQALLPSEKSILETKYSRSVNKILPKIVPLLYKRGKLEILGRVGKQNYYGVPGVIDKKKSDLSSFKSDRGKAFELVKKAVLFYGRALQMGEILEFAVTLNEYENFPPKSIRHAILSLKQTGEVTKVTSIRGDSKGFGLYLPSDFNTDDFLPKEPPTWLEFVLSVFNETWKEHLSEAKEKNKRPFPITTGEIRTKIIESGKFPEKLKRPMIIVSAIRQLADSRQPSIKKIKRPNQKAVFWIPIEIQNCEIDLGDAYAHDTERLEKAVRRAASRLNRPVELFEIKKEFTLDASLQLTSSSAYHSLLSDVTRVVKTRIGECQLRANWRFHRVGKFQGRTFYYPTNSPEARAYVEFNFLKWKWASLSPDAQINSIETSVLPTAAFGRMILLSQEIEYILNRIRKLKKLQKILGVTEKEFKSFIKNLRAFKVRINEYLESKSSEFSHLPKTVNNKIEGLIAQELLDLLSPFYHRLQSKQAEDNFRSLIKNEIRRFSNPNFKRTNLKNPRLAAEYLYDETDALIYIAKTWGGAEARFQANLAVNELGLLRDITFVLPDLDNEDFNIRLSAVSCLAFLQSKECTEKLRTITLCDKDAGVRQSALWAYGFRIGEGAINFIRECILRDEDIRVRNFARNLVENYSGKWLDF